MLPNPPIDLAGFITRIRDLEAVGNHVLTQPPVAASILPVNTGDLATVLKTFGDQLNQSVREMKSMVQSTWRPPFNLPNRQCRTVPHRRTLGIAKTKVHSKHVNVTRFRKSRASTASKRIIIIAIVLSHLNHRWRTCWRLTASVIRETKRPLLGGRNGPNSSPRKTLKTCNCSRRYRPCWNRRCNGG